MVLALGEELTVQVGSEVHRCAAMELRRRFERDDGASCCDNTSLVHLNDATILENLKARHGARHSETPLKHGHLDPPIIIASFNSKASLLEPVICLGR